MIPRFRAWLEETHSDNFELVRHFAGGFFDSETVALPGEWLRVAVGVFAALLSAGFLALTTYWGSFNRMEDAGLSAARIFTEIRGDQFSFIAVAFGVTALLTALEWQALFPSRRDCLALAGLPLSARQIFLAKFGALLLVFTVFVFAMNLPWAIEFGMATSGHWQPDPGSLRVIAANFLATGGIAIFVFFSLLAVQGILLNLLPERIFSRVSLVTQSAVFIAALGALPLYDRQPLADWWPSVWFIHLWESIVRGAGASAREALLAMTIPAVVAVLAYLLSYHRYRRLLLEGRSAPPRGNHAGAGSWLLELFLPDPRRQAAFAFIWKTLVRSRTHRLILLAYAGIAIGAITKGALDVPRPSLHDQGMYGLLIVLGPLALALLVTVGLRYLFSLPESLPANWVFQTTDRDGSAAWLAAVTRFVVCCGILPVFVAAFPAAVAILGLVRAAAAGVLSFFFALVWFEILFRRWSKLPFTCSYLPGRQHFAVILVRYGFATSLLAPAGQLILYCSAEPTAFAALLTFLGTIWWRLRSKRRRFWSECLLRYEEDPEAAIQTLRLQQPAESDSAPARPAPVVANGELYEPTLLASGGLLPRAWREEIREEGRRPFLLLETLWEDIRFAFRLIRRNPLLSLVVVLTLTIGIGINASIFTVVNGVSLRPHIYKDPASFVRIVPMARWQGTPRAVSYAEYVDLRDHSRSLRQLAAYTFFLAMIGDDDANGTAGLAVSCNFFAVEGLDRPLLGRLFIPDDCRSTVQVPAVIISEAVWHSRFASNPQVVGRVARINNRSVTIAGVVPNGSSRWVLTRPPGIWLPYTALTYFAPDRDIFKREDLLALDLAGRLTPGYTRDQAQAEFFVLEHRQDRMHPGRHTAVETTDGSWAEEWDLYASARELMLMAFFLATFNLVLFIACANVATLLLSRAAARRREIAVRLSLGVSRVRLLRMLVTESLLLAALAGAASVALALRVPAPLYRFLASRPADFPLPTDWRIFVYIAAVVFAAGILAGIAPALESLKVDLAASLKGHGAILGPAAASARLRSLLVTAQVAFSMVLLVEAGLFARSEQRALSGDTGYQPQRVVVATVRFPDTATSESTRARLDAIVARLKSLPGVHSVAFSDELPLWRPETVELSPPLRPDASQPVDIFTASPHFFETMGIPILRGREFQVSDTSGVVVCQSLAKAFWPRRDPIGKMLALPGGAVPVVGIARDIEPMRLGGSDNLPIWRLHRLQPQHNVMSVRFDAGASSGALAVRNALRESDPDLILFPRLLQNWIDEITANLWNVASLIVVLGIVATVLATAGIYGAVSFAVNQRTRDLGIRMALGAGRFDIIREVLLLGGKPVAHGLIAGLWLAVPTAVGLRETVRGSPIRIDSGEPLLYCAAAIVLAGAALVAMMGPARRGANSDPLEALRCE